MSTRRFDRALSVHARAWCRLSEPQSVAPTLRSCPILRPPVPQDCRAYRSPESARDSIRIAVASFVEPADSAEGAVIVTHLRIHVETPIERLAGELQHL